MDIEKLGIKELYEANFKATFDMKVGNKQFQPGESVLFFKNLKLVTINEPVSIVKSTGGRGNATHVVWENPKDVELSLQAGVLDRMGFNVLTQANVTDGSGGLAVPKTVENFFDNNGEYDLGVLPLETKAVFLYIVENNKLTLLNTSDYTITDGRLSAGSENANKEFRISFYYTYDDGYTRLRVDKNRMNGVFKFEGKAYYKDENDGLMKTAIIQMPKLKLVSNLQLILGEQADPLVSTFMGIATPGQLNIGESDVVIDIQLLDSDIDATL